jgi:hypothetical protein
MFSTLHEDAPWHSSGVSEPDPWQTRGTRLFAAPKVGLYLISILVVRFVEPKRQGMDEAGR